MADSGSRETGPFMTSDDGSTVNRVFDQDRPAYTWKCACGVHARYVSGSFSLEWDDFAVTKFMEHRMRMH